MKKQFNLSLKHKKIIAIFFMCVCCYSFSFCQKSKDEIRDPATTFVSVVPITKYDFRVINSSPLNLEVTISGQDQFVLGSGRSKTFTSHIVNDFTTMQLGYNSIEYERVRKYCAEQAKKLKQDKKTTDAIFKAELELLKANAKDVGAIPAVGYSAFIFRKNNNNNNRIRASQYSNNTRRRLNEEMYAASLGRVNEYTEDFKKFKLKQYTNVRIFMAPKVKLETAFQFNRKDHNDFWDKKGGDTDWGMTYAHRIGGELQLGKSKRFLSLYGFAAWNKENFGLERSGINNYFVDSTYVKFSMKPTYNLFTTELVNLNFNRWSAGLMAEFYFYPEIFVNFRVGYNFLKLSHIEFEQFNGADQEVFHLESPFEFNSRKNHKAVDFHEENFYGQVRLGWYITSSGKNLPRKGYYVTIGYELTPRTIYTIGEGNSLFYSNELGELENVPINSDKDSKYIQRFTWSIGMAF